MFKRISCILLLPLILLSASCGSFEKEPVKAEEPDLASYAWLETDPDAILYPTMSKKDGYSMMYGLVNQKWEVTYEAVFTSLSPYYVDGKVQAYFASRGDGKTLVIDMQGRLIATLPALKVIQYEEAPIVILTTSDETYKQGLFDMPSLSMLIPPKKEQSIFYVNRETVWVMSPEAESYLYHIPTKTKRDLDNDIRYVPAGNNTTTPILVAKETQEYEYIYNYIDARNNYISQDWYHHAEPFTGEYAIVEKADNGQYYFIDKNAVTQKEAYDSIDQRWENGLYIVENSSGSAVLDLNLNEVFPMQHTVQFEILTTQYETFILQKQEGKAAKIYQADGAFLGEFDTVHLLDNIYAVLGEGIFSCHNAQDSKTLFMDFNRGKSFWLPHPYYEAQLRQEKYILVQTNETVHVYSLQGDELHDTVYHRFQSINSFNGFLQSWQNVAAALGQSRSEMYWVQQGRYQGYIDQEGNWLYKESRYLLLSD